MAYFRQRFDLARLSYWGKHYVRRLRRRLAGVNQKTVHLEPLTSENRGSVLFSYIIDPFLLPPESEIPYGHTNFWEAWRMAQTFRERGYAVDVIHWTRRDFQPERDYRFYIDVRRNFEKIAPLLNGDCQKILHIDTAHHAFYNAAQKRRLAELADRRGIIMPPFKTLEENRAIELADRGTILGDDYTAGTYSYAGKPLHHLPISCPFIYPFPEGKDFAACRRNFLWFGSEGFVHKGLDLVLDAFAGLPDFQLFVCGPIYREPAFERAYYRELYRTPNIHTVGWVDVGGKKFRDIMNRCVGLVYPSCSEGCCGGVVNCMHAGMIPVVSQFTGVDITAENGVMLSDCRVLPLRAALRNLAGMDVAQLRKMARSAWNTARSRYTRETFERSYKGFVDGLLVQGR